MSCVGRAWKIGCVYNASVVRGCALLSASSSLIYRFWFLKHNHSAATHHHHCRWDTQLSYPWKLHACRANNNYFLHIFFYLLLYVFGLFLIVLYRAIVTVYMDNIFPYNYQWQMLQIIHLSPVGCFTPARGKTVQKNREVSGVNIHARVVAALLGTSSYDLYIFYTSKYLYMFVCIFFCFILEVNVRVPSTLTFLEKS